MGYQDREKYEKLIEDGPVVCTINNCMEDTTFLCYSYRKNIWKTVIYYLGCLITAGFLLLITHWKPNWRLIMTHSQCCLALASKVIITDQYGCYFVESVDTEAPWKEAILESDVQFIKVENICNGYKYFWHKNMKYIFSSVANEFLSIENINVLNYSDIHCSGGIKGINKHYRKLSLQWFGLNKIDIKVKSYIKLFFEECVNPFYIFQILSCILWFSDTYYYYASAIIIISLLSIFLSIRQARKYLLTLHNMIAQSNAVKVLNSNGEVEEFLSEYLVPGDILILPKNGITMLCDAVLLNGSVIVNESMLTGESIPVTKTPFPNLPPHDVAKVCYDCFKHKSHTLFCGTEILQTRLYGDEKVVAMVTKTGFSTLKGGLVRSILFPKPVDFKFFSDALKFVAVFSIFAVCGLSYSIYANYKNGSTTEDLVKKSLDVITISVPPALPAAMSVGTVYSLKRLMKKNIFCISQSHINISGKIKLFCFDKTGTLTEDGLDYCGVISSGTIDSLGFKYSFDATPRNDHITVAMATCHSLTIINDKICGDPLDIQMFTASNWQLEEAGSSKNECFSHIISTIVRQKGNIIDSAEINVPDKCKLLHEAAILKQYTFTSELQRMSVIVHKLGSNNMDLYAKGSPEMICSLCDVSTIPRYYEECLQLYASQGYRVLALAHKPLPLSLKYQNYQRSEAETKLNFLGLLVMKNLVKPQTAPTIKQLYDAKIRVVMVTGDNILTAISVARECKIVKNTDQLLQVTEENDELVFKCVEKVDSHLTSESCDSHPNLEFLKRNYHLVITGKCFQTIYDFYPELLEKLLVCGTIFARMLPEQKTLLVEHLQKLGYGVGMCGDGANDCGALKRAHAGISLSETEASIASPFTSKTPDISCVINVIKEGRCALVTSFNIFKFMALYSMIQFSSVLILYSISSNLGDFQYLYIDLFIITSFAVTLSRSAPANLFTTDRPLGRLVHPFVFFSLVLQVFTQTAFQVLCFFYVQSSPFYKPRSYFSGNITCFENTALFTFSSFQYIIIAVVFSAGKPFRQPFFYNKLFVLAVISFISINIVIMGLPKEVAAKLFQLLFISDRRYYLVFVGLVLCNLLTSAIIDHVILNVRFVRRCLKLLLFKKGPRNRYKVVMKDIANDNLWPPKNAYKSSSHTLNI